MRPAATFAKSNCARSTVKSIDLSLREEITMMSRLSIVVLVLLLAAGCSSHEEMKELQQRCNSGDQDACAQLNPVPVLPRPGPG